MGAIPYGTGPVTSILLSWFLYRSKDKETLSLNDSVQHLWQITLEYCSKPCSEINNSAPVHKILSKEDEFSMRWKMEQHILCLEEYKMHRWKIHKQWHQNSVDMGKTSPICQLKHLSCVFSKPIQKRVLATNRSGMKISHCHELYGDHLFIF